MQIRKCEAEENGKTKKQHGTIHNDLKFGQKLFCV